MKKLFLNTLALLAIAAGCTEKIDIDLDESYTRLVVYGEITTDPGTHYIDLAKTTSYYYNEVPPPVTGASLTITDDSGESVDLAETQVPGRYATPPQYHVVTGSTYTLDITLEEEINGFKHYSANSSVTPINQIDSIGLLFQPNWGEEGFFEVTCYYQEPTTKDFYMFNILKNGEMLTDTISNRFVSSDDFYNGSYTNGIGVGYLDQSVERQILHPGDTVTFQACNISEEYYYFIYTLQQETGFSTPLFSGPPANVKGNITNGAIGYFATYSTSYSSTVYQP